MKVLIIGGVAAGTKTAAKLKREDRSAEVTVITKDQDISYAGCGLPYYVGGLIEGRDELIVNTPQKYSGLTGVEVRTGKEAVALDPAKKEVTVKDVLTGSQEVCPYDKLVIAVGASASELPIPGKDLAGVFKMRTPDDADAIRTYIDEKGVKRAVVVGAGRESEGKRRQCDSDRFRHTDPAKYSGSGDGSLCQEASDERRYPCDHRHQRSGDPGSQSGDRREDICGNLSL